MFFHFPYDILNTSKIQNFLSKFSLSSSSDLSNQFILQVPVYWLAQYLGALLGAAVLYGIYADGIGEALGKNVAGAGIFASFPNPSSSTATLIVDQALATALLLVIILAVTDKRNMDVPSGLIPPLIGLGLAAIHISFAYNAGCAINPARDLSP